MNRFWTSWLASFAFFIPLAASAQQEQVLPEKPAIEILSFKIGSDYYPMLDRNSPMFTADNPDFPRVETERMARRTRSVQMEEARSRGRLKSEIRIIDQAQWVHLVIKNTSDKAIKTVDWDFAFPRYVDNKLELRFDVFSKAEIKPGRKKTLKQPLPAGASRCKAIVVTAEPNSQDKGEKAKTFEAVCGPGFQDPSQLKNQESITIKRIEYSDGSLWQSQREK